jgi:hypothetical protein
MQHKNTDAKAVPGIVADTQGNTDETGAQQEQVTRYVYRTDNGGILISPTKLDEEVEPAFVDVQPPQREPPFFAYFLLLLLMFLLLDLGNSAFVNLLTPTISVALIPQVKTISLQSSMTLGRLLAPITVSQHVTVAATGQGHQMARAATGIVTFSNGQQNAYIVPAGTTFTGSDGVTVITTAPADIPAGDPSTGYGTVTVSAQAEQVGSRGNIALGDINATTAIAVFVRNNRFQGGQDERYFSVVKQSDIATAASTLQASVTASMTAALHSQLAQGEQLQKEPCSPAISPDHHVGDEAQQVTVTVSETCSAVVYNSAALIAQAAKLIRIRGEKAGITGYMRSGGESVQVIQVAIHNQTVLLSFTAQASYIFQLTTGEEQRIRERIAGENRVTALRQLAAISGIQRASISGVQDDQLLPDDPQHIHLFVIFLP